MCAGDVGFFLAFDIISSFSFRSKKLVFNYFVGEITRVILAQMQDAYFGKITTMVSKEEILKVYYYKTACYTFSLPFVVGSLLAQDTKDTIDQLKKLGKYLGLIFQIKDDELGMWGNKKELGKPVGSDIKEGKKTLLYFFLYENASSTEKKKLNKIFGNSNLQKTDLTYVQSLLQNYAVQQKINAQLDVYYKRSLKIINQLKMNRASKKVLQEILDYSMHRTS